MAPERDGADSRVLVTGATGFLGRHVVAHLVNLGWSVTAAVRAMPGQAERVPSAQYVVVGNVGGATDWAPVLRGVTAIVHTAGLVHVMHGGVDAAFNEVNELGTASLASQAASHGVRRLVFLSSIKVNGERTARRPFRADDVPAPIDAYARSKLAAETALWRVCARSQLEGCVIRLPLVYGPGVRANVDRLVRIVRSGMPLPLASIDNRRSLVGVANACDFIARVLDHPLAARATWLVSDGDDLSTPELVRGIARALRRPARLVPCPVAALSAVARLFGRDEEIARLTESLQVDIIPARQQLDWRPPFTVAEGLAEMLGLGSLTPFARMT